VSDYLTLCERAARAGGEQLLVWADKFSVREKGPADLVTEADFASQEAIREMVLRECPGHGFISEEADARAQNAEFCWFVDPLDGTTNYVHRLPHYAVSVALAHGGRLLAGVVYDPVRQECFAAEQGRGSFLNGTPIRASTVTRLSQALIAANFPPRVQPESEVIPQFIAVVLASQSVRRTGSAALNLAYIAAGRLDAFWAQTTQAWDIAAGTLLVLEAGGVVTDFENQPLDLQAPFPVASSTMELHGEFLGLLRGAGSQA
jgi:myo-inositol-1(or 4)-monophosphatase